MILFVRILINAQDEVDATYSDSGSEDLNNNDLEDDYDDYREDIFDDLEYDDSDKEEEQEQDYAIEFSTLSDKIICAFKKLR